VIAGQPGDPWRDRVWAGDARSPSHAQTLFNRRASTGGSQKNDAEFTIKKIHGLLR